MRAALLFAIALGWAATTHAKPKRKATIELLDDGTWRFVGPPLPQRVRVLPDGHWRFEEDQVPTATGFGPDGAFNSLEGELAAVWGDETRETGDVPKIALGAPVVRGPYDARIVPLVFGRHRNETRYCYEKYMNQRRDLAGRVRVRFTIDRGGSVSATSVLENTMQTEDVGRCLAGKLRRWVFPAPAKGEVTVEQSFEFSP